MTIHALATGKLFRDPEERTSRNANKFVKATIVVVSGSERQFVSLVAFAQAAQAELLRLREGDSLSVQGPLKADIYERDGQARVGMSMTVDHIISLRQPPKERRPKAEKPAHPAPAPDRSQLARHAGDGAADLNDEIPF